jgi:hypothetical protein
MLLTLSNVALKIDPKVRAELLSRTTTITQPDAINSTEANQTSPIVCEVKLRADVWADGGYTTERITASETQELSRRNRRRVQESPTYLAHIYRVGLIESSLSVLSQASQRVKFFASQVLCTWLAVSQGKCSSRLARILSVLRGLFDWRHERFLALSRYRFGIKTNFTAEPMLIALGWLDYLREVLL